MKNWRASLAPLKRSFPRSSWKRVHKRAKKVFMYHGPRRPFAFSFGSRKRFKSIFRGCILGLAWYRYARDFIFAVIQNKHGAGKFQFNSEPPIKALTQKVNESIKCLSVGDFEVGYEVQYESGKTRGAEVCRVRHMRPEIRS
jgi:hypothetical protein